MEHRKNYLTLCPLCPSVQNSTFLFGVGQDHGNTSRLSDALTVWTQATGNAAPRNTGKNLAELETCVYYQQPSLECIDVEDISRRLFQQTTITHMKTTIPTILLSLMFGGIASAGFEKWTNKDGRTAELELIKVTGEEGAKVGEFKMRNGKTINIKSGDLSVEAAEKLGAWTAPAPAAATKTEAEPSVFDKALSGQLVKLTGKSLKKFEMVQPPKKYYVFYYTASWCGPCQQFTPSLVKFYEKNKNENFELVLITSDQDEASMEDYAKEKKMPWPQLKLKKAQDFKQEFQHGVTGIPSLIVCDTKGQMLGNYRSKLEELEALVK